MDDLTPDDPQQIGPYNILAHLGSGGMGQVYLGRAEDGQRVAIKVMNVHRAQDVDRKRFQREVRAAQRVDGPYTAKILAADTEADQAWYASEYKPGLTLAETVREHGQLPIGTVITLAWGLFHALEQIHAARLVHRDLKPANIIMGPDNPSVIDYGIAHHQDDVALTQIGTIVGTVHYLCPEQVMGGRPQPSWDIFAFGSLLVYALTGHTAFGAGKIGAEIMMAIKDDKPDLRGVPRPFLPLIQRCLEKSPDRRQNLDDIRRFMPRQEAPTKLQPTWLPADVATSVQEAVDSSENFVGRAQVPYRRRTIPTRRERYLPKPRVTHQEVKKAKKKKAPRPRRWLLPLILAVLVIPAFIMLSYEALGLYRHHAYAGHLAAPRFVASTPGKAHLRGDQQSNIQVNKVSANGYRLTVSVTVAGFAGKSAQTLAQTCTKISNGNQLYTIQPLGTTVGEKLIEHGVPIQQGTMSFDLTLPGSYRLIIGCQDAGVPAELGTNRIDTRVAIYNGQLLSVMGEMRQGSKLVVFERGAKKLLGAQCLKTTQGLVYPLTQERFESSGTGFWAFTFEDSDTSSLLYPYCYTDERTTQTDHVGTGAQL